MGKGNPKIEVRCTYCRHRFTVPQELSKIPEHTHNGKIRKSGLNYVPCFGSNKIGTVVKPAKVKDKIEYFIDNKPSSLLEIIEKNPKRNIWKEYLEKNKLQDSESAKRYLKRKIGDYISASEINKRTGISTRTLNKWREKRILKAELLKGRWYYSFKSVLNAIKTADIDELR